MYYTQNTTYGFKIGKGPRAFFRIHKNPYDETYYFIFYGQFCPNEPRCNLLLDVHSSNLTLSKNSDVSFQLEKKPKE